MINFIPRVAGSAESFESCARLCASVRKFIKVLRWLVDTLVPELIKILVVWGVEWLGVEGL